MFRHTKIENVNDRRLVLAASVPITVAHGDIAGLVSRAPNGGVDFIKAENHYTFGGKPGFSMGQGQ